MVVNNETQIFQSLLWNYACSISSLSAEEQHGNTSVIHKEFHFIVYTHNIFDLFIAKIYEKFVDSY